MNSILFTKKSCKGDLLLMDRGYPGIALLFLLMVQGLDFCIRMKEDWWLSVKEFNESWDKERLVSFELPGKDKDMLKEHPEYDKEITCRLVCVSLENGEKEILCTSLIDTEKYPHECFQGLYHLRWNEEEGYKLFKARAEIECFTGKTALAVKQDFHVRMFAMSYCTILAFPIEEKVRKEYNEDKNKYAQKINRTESLSMFRDVSIGLLIKKKTKQNKRY